MEWLREFSPQQMGLVEAYPVRLPLVVAVVYVALVWLGQRSMRQRKALELGKVQRAWNLFLACLSLVMFLGIAPQTLKRAFDEGVFELICMPGGELYVGPQLFFVYLFTAVKYLELLDTALLVLRKRPVSLLHVYHYTTVPAYAWLCLLALPGGAVFVFTMTNAAVHTAKYWWYYRSGSGAGPSWAQVVTLAQLCQMLLGLFMAATWTTFYFAGYECHGSLAGLFLVTSLALYASYFLLFLLFYVNRYLLRRSSARARLRQHQE